MSEVGYVTGEVPFVSVVLGPPGSASGERRDDPGDRSVEIESVVDTGFDGGLVISSDLLEEAGVTADGFTEVVLADGREERVPTVVVRLACGSLKFDAVGAFVMGGPRKVLVGMALLAGHRLTVDCREGGPVTISPLPQ